MKLAALRSLLLVNETQRRKDRERTQRWRDRNPEKVTEQRRLRGQHASPAAKRNATKRTRKWRVDNPERVRANGRKNSRAYYARNPERSRDYYERHKEQARRSVRRGRHDKRAFLAEVVGAACVDCGDDRPGAVEYHHPDGKTKGQVPLTHLSWEALKDEALKLIALCGACHGVRHHKEHQDEAS